MQDDDELELQELLEEVRRIEVQAERLVKEMMAGGYTSVFRGAGIEFDEVREYIPGDDPRAVDWNVTARVGRPYVKKYIDERELTVLFALDLSGSMEAGFGPWSSRQTAARILACLAIAAVKNGDKVGLVAFGSEVERHVPPKKGLAHVLRILRDALALPSHRGTTNLARALDFISSVARKRCIVFLLSDFLCRDYDHALGLAARRHDLIAVRLTPPEIMAPDGFLRARDPETNEVRILDFSSPIVAAEWRRRVTAHRREVEDRLRRVGVDLMEVPVPRRRDKDAIARPIISFFRMRQRRGAKR